MRIKKNASLRSVLGITQRDAAIILKVSRTQLSLYELNRRDIPAQALQMLTEAWLYAETAKKSSKENSFFLKEEKESMKAFLKKEIRDNQLEQLKMQREIKNISQKYASIETALYALECWKQQVEDTSSKEMEALRVIEGKTMVKLYECGRHVQDKYQIKLQALEHYGQLLEERSKR